MIETLLQFFGTVGLATLGVICVMLSLEKNKHLILISGQSIFRWLSFTLIIVSISRGISFIIHSSVVVDLNSTIFLISVIGIVWSVARHATARTN